MSAMRGAYLPDLRILREKQRVERLKVCFNHRRCLRGRNPAPVPERLEPKALLQRRVGSVKVQLGSSSIRNARHDQPEGPRRLPVRESACEIGAPVVAYDDGSVDVLVGEDVGDVLGETFAVVGFCVSGLGCAPVTEEVGDDAGVA